MVYAYLLTPKGIAEKASMTRRFFIRKTEEYELLKAEVALLQPELVIAQNKGYPRLPAGAWSAPPQNWTSATPRRVVWPSFSAGLACRVMSAWPTILCGPKRLICWRCTRPHSGPS
jgi:hypothetical protein